MDVGGGQISEGHFLRCHGGGSQKPGQKQVKRPPSRVKKIIRFLNLAYVGFRPGLGIRILYFEKNRIHSDSNPSKIDFFFNI